MSVYSTKRTIDHQEIRRWAEERSGRPATITRTAEDSAPGILRIAFPCGGADEALEPISWDEFFDQFEDADLAFLYQDTLEAGQPSRFYKMVRRTEADLRAHERRRPKAA